MIFSRKSGMARRFGALGLAFALFACGVNDGEGSDAFIPGSEDFVLLVRDARLAMQRGELVRAGELLDEALGLEPENPALWVDIARLRYRGGEHIESIAAADRALTLGPQYGPALLMRAQLVRDAHGLADSLAWFEAAIAADPTNAEIRADYAATLGDLGRHRDMLNAVRDLAEIAPDDPAVHYLQAVLAARAGNVALARSLLERSNLVERQVPAAMLLDALISQAQGNHASAIERLEALSTRQPGNVRVRELLARSLLMAGREEEVLVRFGERALSPEASPYIAMVVARAHERLGARNKAAPLLVRAYAAPTGRPVVLPASGPLPKATANLRALTGSGNLVQARSAAQSLRSRFPGSADIHALSGDVALVSGDARTALEFYSVAARVRRPWPLLRKAIAAYRQIGDAEAADVLLMRHLSGDPNNIDALIMFAQRSAELEDWGRVTVLINHVVALGGGNDPALRALRARVPEAK
jgi:predicted Zn-dependent protease